MGYNPHARDYRSAEEKREDAARDFAELLVDELIERIAQQGGFCFEVGSDTIVDAYTDLIAGTDLVGKIDRRRKDLMEEQKRAPQKADIRRDAAE